jgi:hypothetical protein
MQRSASRLQPRDCHRDGTVKRTQPQERLQPQEDDSCRCAAVGDAQWDRVPCAHVCLLTSPEQVPLRIIRDSISRAPREESLKRHLRRLDEEIKAQISGISTTNEDEGSEGEAIFQGLPHAQACL